MQLLRRFFLLLMGLFTLVSCISDDLSKSKAASVDNYGPKYVPVMPKVIQNNKAIDWKRENIYFLLVDRFANGSADNDGKSVAAKASLKDKLRSYMGGDIAGVINKLDYLKDMGVTAIWLSPIIDNPNIDYMGWWPYHGYSPLNQFKVEEHFGDVEIFKKLVAESHKRGLKVVFDMVYNQVASEHPWVANPENWNTLGYSRWFHPHSGKDNSTSIQNWQNQQELEDKELYGLPDLNQDNPNVYAYLLDVSRYWIQNTGVDGFRLDAVKHINSKFWQRINSELHAEFGTDFLMLGEVFDGSPEYISKYQTVGFNSIFDIPLYFTLRSVFATGSSMETLSDQYLKNQKTYLPGTIMSTLIDNHDVARFSQRAQTKVAEKIKLALAFINSINGIPVLYYGTEVALEGGEDKNAQGESTDYLNRLMMPWERVPQELKPNGIISFIKVLFAARKQHESLYNGQFLELYKDTCVYVFAKVSTADISFPAFNNCDSVATVEFDNRFNLVKSINGVKNLMGATTVGMIGNKITLTLPPLAAQIYNFNNPGVVLPANFEMAVNSSGKIGSDFISVPFSFKYKPEKGDKIYLAGDFNGWSATKNALTFNVDKQAFEIFYPLKRGKYRYKFVINGTKWVADDSAKVFEDDGYGGKNAVLVVP